MRRGHRRENVCVECGRWVQAPNLEARRHFIIMSMAINVGFLRPATVVKLLTFS